MSLPKALSFPQLKANAIASVSSQYAVTPSNSATNYGPSSTLQFDIPCSQRATWLDPTQTYLKFSVTPALTGGTTPQWSAFPMDFIRTMSLYSSAGSNLIESLDHYSSYHTLIRDLHSDYDNTVTSDTIMLGGDPSRLRAPLQQNSGVSINFCVPLATILGLTSAGDTYLPTHALSAPLRLELILHSAEQALACSGAPTAVTYNITSPQLVIGFISISDVAQGSIDSMTHGNYQWNSVIVKTFRNVSPAMQTFNSLLIPARFSSIRNILCTMKQSSNQENSSAYSVNDRVKNYLTSYQFKVGSMYANAKPIDCTNNGPSAYMELRRCMGSVTSESLPSLLTRSDWIKQIATPPGPSASPGAFAIGCELQPFSNIQNLISGTNASASNIFLELNFDSTQAANIVASTIDSFVQVDALVTVSNGMMTVAY